MKYVYGPVTSCQNKPLVPQESKDLHSTLSHAVKAYNSIAVVLEDLDVPISTLGGGIRILLGFMLLACDVRLSLHYVILCVV